jgi:diphosphomevalonate decarboxylase
VVGEALTLCDDDDFDALFHLMKPNTLQIINAIWKFRTETKTPVCFTLDGANVHVLYPENDSAAVLQFIKDELVFLCQNGQYILKLKWFKKLN